MSMNFDRRSLGKFDSRTLNRKTLNRWTGRSTEIGRTTARGSAVSRGASLCIDIDMDIVLVYVYVYVY